MNFRNLAPLAHLLGAFLFVRILQYGWVTDDAFITFRSVLNFVGGDGPVYNIGERVQSFTHPLWFLCLSIGGFLDVNLYFYAIFLGLAFSLATIIALFRLNRILHGESYFMLSIVLGVLAASESFVTFGTSGLENSLTYFLVVSTVIAAVAPVGRLVFYLLAALTLVNRFDAVFLLLPLASWVTFSDWRNNAFRCKTILLGAIPLVLWHSFSLIYYGFLFPNTKYAKVGGRPFLENVQSGVNYLLDSAQAEWHIWIIVLSLPLTLLMVFRNRVFQTEHASLMAALITGVYLQIIYVVVISGGDFMRGRFFTVVAVGGMVAMLFVQVRFSPISKATAIALSTVIFSICGWIGAKEKLLWMAPGVANERNFYKDTLALNLDPDKNYTNHLWASQARELRNTAGVIIGVNGQRGYWIPRTIKLIDPVALTDAFIARLPVEDSTRTGHFTHEIPMEYLLIKTENRQFENWENTDAQILYEKLAIVTESPKLFSSERFRAMIWVWRRYGM